MQSNLDTLNRKAEWPSGIRRGQIASEKSGVGSNPGVGGDIG